MSKVEHDLKTWSQFFREVMIGHKRFEIRKDDRNFQVGDVLCLREWDPVKQEYTGSYLRAPITYKLSGGQFGLETGYCILSLGIPEPSPVEVPKS